MLVTDGNTSWDTANQHGSLRFWHYDSHNDCGTGAIFRMGCDQSLAFQVTGSGQYSHLYLSKASLKGSTGGNLTAGGHMQLQSNKGLIYGLNQDDETDEIGDSNTSIGGFFPHYFWDNAGFTSGSGVAPQYGAGSLITSDGDIAFAESDNGAIFAYFSMNSPTTYGFQFGGPIKSSHDIIAYYTSDIRLKKNIIKIDNAIDKISQLNGITFEWKDKEGKGDIHYNEREAGIIAQDVIKVLPEAVKERETGLGVKYEQLIPLLIEGIKEQQEQINKLKEDVKRLSTGIK